MSSSLRRIIKGESGSSEEIRKAASSWQRTLIVVWIAEFISLIGFAMVMPFLPFYVQELGVSDPDQVKFWSGLIVSAHAVTMGIFAPIWGSVADRYGRKLMLERAIFGAAIVVTLMGFAQSPQQLLALRLLQGCLTGTVPAATTLVAGTVPRERTGFALGWLQMGIFAGVSVGPLVGGLVADTLGYQTSFLVTGSLLFVSGLGVLFFVREDFKRPQLKPGEQNPRWWEGLAMAVRSRELLIVLVTRLLTRTGVRVIGPVLPLFVATLIPESSRLATMAGIVTGASAASSSIGSVVLGRAGDRIGYRRVLLASAIAAAILYAMQAAVTNTTQLILLQFCVGAALSGTISSLTALLAMLAPDGRQGAVYGLSTSVVSGANALGPMLGASLAVVLGNRATFLLAAGIFALSAVLIGWLLPDRTPEPGSATEPRDVRHGQQARVAKTR
jgi:DHA1 family multidrug resistance protein-like MFS transporter